MPKSTLRASRRGWAPRPFPGYGWDSVAILDVEESAESNELGAARSVTVTIDPGRLDSDDIDVQIIFGPVDLEGNLTEQSEHSMRRETSENGSPAKYRASLGAQAAGQHGFAIRAVPAHPEMRHFTSLNRVTWAK